MPAGQFGVSCNINTPVDTLRQEMTGAWCAWDSEAVLKHSKFLDWQLKVTNLHQHCSTALPTGHQCTQ